MATDVPDDFTLDDYHKLIKEKNAVVVVDFHAQWCGPCKAIAPKLQNELAVMEGVSVLKVDVDECEDLARALEISAMPTFIIYKNGEKVDSFMGANYEKLKEMVDKYL